MVDIQISANTNVIDQMLKAIRGTEKQVKRATVKLAVEHGVEYAKRNLRGYLGRDSRITPGIEGDLSALNSGEGEILSTHPASVYVEYGTGTVGERTPHPTGPAPGGFRQTPWYVEDPDYSPEAFWTRGQISKPFMFNTYMHLRDMFGK